MANNNDNILIHMHLTAVYQEILVDSQLIRGYSKVEPRVGQPRLQPLFGREIIGSTSRDSE
jgi:hypothetical protein